MTIIRELNRILNSLKQGDLSVINRESTLLLNNEAKNILDSKDIDQNQIINMGLIIGICNILYNNTDIDPLPVEDGVYDLLLELHKKYNPQYQVGAEPIFFEATNNTNKTKPISAIQFIDTDKINNEFIFANELSKEPKLTKVDMLKPCIIFDDDNYISKRITDTKHIYPELVGSLDKCKFVLSRQAEDRGVLNEPNVKILERDFFGKHIQSGILDPSRKISMILELKYDGVSVEGEVSNIVHSARTRGDANEDIGADITPILGGYSFRHAYEIPYDEKFGMKFEAIMTYDNLWKYNLAKNYNYKNCRTAITSIFSSSDAFNYKEFITLVPLATSLDIDRITEVEFMNKYYHSGEYLRYAVITGTYVEILFQIKRFVEEAEFMRQYMPFMYDGVVISYIDKDLIQKLGRSNSINQYSVAVKFNPIKKQSIFRGYKYTVGQDGVITPMIYFDPIEFFGGIHDHTSGHSYDRFKKLQLREEDILDIEYVNDVMPYVFKPDNSYNANNPNPIVEFIIECPSCGNELKISKSGKTIFCDNIDCPERNISRMVGMLQKLNLKDFSEVSLRSIAKFSLSELLNLKKSDVEFLGDITSDKFIERMNTLKTAPIYDYRLVGSIGFTGVAIEKWKLILSKHTLSEILEMHHDDLRSFLTQIKGIGPQTIDTIIWEFDFFREDLEYINNMSNVIQSKGVKMGKKIRFTGFRDSDLVKKLIDMGHDANDNAGVTSTTDILLVPHPRHGSKKVSDAGPNTEIVLIDDFIQNMDLYLSE